METNEKMEVVRMSPPRKGSRGMVCIREVMSPLNATVAAIGSDEESEAVADHFVKCWNNHDVLLGQLKKAISMLHADTTWLPEDYPANSIVARATAISGFENAITQ